MTRKKETSPKEMDCYIKELPPDKQVEAAETARAINPVNAVPMIGMMTMLQGLNQYYKPEPERLAIMVGKYWGPSGVDLTVGWLDNPSAALRGRVLAAANLWGKNANIRFRPTQTDPQVRISRNERALWSYLGTDLLSIPKTQPTMMLGGYSDSTPDAEIIRSGCHEFAHSLGFPHEHLRSELIGLLDEEKTYAYFERTQGWSRTVTKSQVLTPLSQASIRGTPNADQDSILCYSLPGSITKNGQRIRGGAVINALDHQFAGTVYPLAVPPPPPPPPGSSLRIALTGGSLASGNYVLSPA